MCQITVACYIQGQVYGKRVLSPFQFLFLSGRFPPLFNLEWRVSFNAAERKLSKSLLPVQKSCYSLVKLMLKAGLSSSSILTSYHVKNMMFWFITFCICAVARSDLRRFFLVMSRLLCRNGTRTFVHISL
jgi:hypothetical protein